MGRNGLRCAAVDENATGSSTVASNSPYNPGEREFMQERFIFDVGLGYKLTKHTSLYVSGRNIFTKTKYPGLDPEVSSLTANSSYTRGVDNSSIPNLKSYQVGVNVGF